jgi:hypothetical protein
MNKRKLPSNLKQKKETTTTPYVILLWFGAQQFRILCPRRRAFGHGRRKFRVGCPEKISNIPLEHIITNSRVILLEFSKPMEFVTKYPIHLLCNNKCGPKMGK